MFRNVLVGVDGRQGGRDAIALAKLLATPEARITLAHVYGPDWLLGRGSGAAVPFERDEAEQLLRTEREEAAIDAEIVSAAYAPPGRGLHELAERRSADLIVVGSTRHALLGRVLMGDDARAAFNGAPCAIAVAPRWYGHFEHRLEWLGVGYDGSAESAYALTAARDLAALHGAKIKALWVVSVQAVRDEKPIPADWPKAIDGLLEQCSQRLREVSGVYGVATYGGPREELARLAQELDLLIVGSRGYGPRRRLFHGTVSSYLVGHTACPLLVLPRSASQQAESDGAERDRGAWAGTAV